MSVTKTFNFDRVALHTPVQPELPNPTQNSIEVHSKGRESLMLERQASQVNTSIRRLHRNQMLNASKLDRSGGCTHMLQRQRWLNCDAEVVLVTAALPARSWSGLDLQ
jgi:hypothetical protein